MTEYYNTKITSLRFRAIDSTADEQREFLEALPRFRQIEQESPEEVQRKGFLMPAVGNTVFGPVVKIDFITLEKNLVDGVIEIHHKI